MKPSLWDFPLTMRTERIIGNNKNMKIIEVTIKQASNGNDYKQVTIDEKISEKDRFNVFNNHSMYGNMVVGSIVELNNLEFDGKYLNLKDGDKKPSGGGKEGGMNRTMETKAKNIEHAQDKKEEAIKLASTARMATDMVVAFGGSKLSNPEDEYLQGKWQEWRAYFYVNWNEVDVELAEPFE